MKKFLLLIAASATLVCGAQSYTSVPSATLEHNGEVTVYYGAAAFAAAYQAAADTLDVIYLSAGEFNNPGVIQKSITVYGVGFETDPATSVLRTSIVGGLGITPAEGKKVGGCHFEGIWFDSDFRVNRVTVNEEDLHVYNTSLIRCGVNGAIRLQAPTHFTTIRQCRVTGNISGSGNDNYGAAQSLLITNCHIGGRIFNFPVSVTNMSSVVVDHCVLSYRVYADYYHGPYFYNNTIFTADYYGGQVSEGATLNYCVYYGRDNYPDRCSGVGNYFGIRDWANVFTEPDKATPNYDETRTFAVKEELVGSDGTPVGVAGGFGWHKFPSLPRVTELSTALSEDAKKVTVTIKADVPE